MPVTELRVSGYRSIRELELPLKRANVIVGPNGCGKSNLYQSIALIRAAAEGALAKRIADEGGVPSILWAGGRKEGPVILHLGVTLDNYEYDLEIGLPQADPTSAFVLDPMVKSETLTLREGASKQKILDRGKSGCTIVDAEGAKQQFRLALSSSESVLDQIVDARRFPLLDDLRRSMLKWRFYHGFRTDADSPLRVPQVGTRTYVLSSDGRDLAAALRTIQENGDDEGLARAIEDAFPGASLELACRGGTFEVAMGFPGVARPLRAKELSDGTLRYLCLVAALLSPTPAPLLALNEPETSLHTDVLKPLARLIARAASQSQIWLTTHSATLAEEVSALMVVSPIALEKVDGATVKAGTPRHRHYVFAED